MKSLLFALAALMLVSCSKQDTSNQGAAKPQLEMVVIPQTLHVAPDIDCGPRPYVCFRYRLVPGNQLNMGAMPQLLAVDRTVFAMGDFCEFKAQPPSGKVLIKQRPSGYRFTFNLIEGEITCNGIATPQSDFLWMIAKDIVLNTNTHVVEGSTASRVQISRGETYLLGDMLYYRLKATSIIGADIAGNFAAIAKSDSDDKYMVIFDGKFDARGTIEP